MRVVLRNYSLLCLLWLVGCSGLQADSGAAVIHWNRAFLQSVEQSSTAPGLVARNLAILNGALFDAAAAARGAPHYLFSTVEAEGAVDESYVLDMVGALCNRVFYPGKAGPIGQRMAERAAQVEPVLRAPSEALARAAVQGAFAARSGDGSANTLTYVPKNAVGKWRRTPPAYRPPELSHWYNVAPFVIADAAQFRPAGPPPLNSPAYAAAFGEVARLGAVDSVERTAEQTRIAHFWSCYTYTSTPVGHWNEILAGILEAQGSGDGLFVARAFALLNLALADTGIAAWDSKYHYEFWRPVHAIAGAELDGNPHTQLQAGWASLLEAPPHPEYVSGHSAFSGAAARMLQQIFATDAIAFAVESPAYPGEPRQFHSLWACAQECGRSRIYGGIHYQFSNEDGLRLGKTIAEAVYTNAFKTDLGEHAHVVN